MFRHAASLVVQVAGTHNRILGMTVCRVNRPYFIHNCQLHSTKGSSETTDVGKVSKDILDVVPPPSFRSVADFYSGKSVFITGVTGLVGKVVLEKLLYTCKDIDNIYVLIRDKERETATQRFEQLIDLPVFSRLKEERPEDLKKIIPIAGDIDRPGLGISNKDEEMLIENVSVVFHIAANISFDETLKNAINTNLTGTEWLLHLCKRMKNIKVLVHFSSCYAYTNEEIIEEKLYPPQAKISDVMKFMQQPNYTDKQVKALIKKQPNTYTFSKALSEDFVVENHGSIPTLIIRPATVSATLKDPIPGWIDQWFGATGIIFTVMKGANRVLLGDGEYVLDLIPADFVANATIVAATRCTSADNVQVYNCCSSSCNPIKIQYLYNQMKRVASKHGYDESIMSITFAKNELMLSILAFFLQTTPSFVMDLYRRAQGKRPKYMGFQSKIRTNRAVTSFFTSYSWIMKADRTRALHASMSPEDREKFPCDPTLINWDEYIDLYVQGITRYLLKKGI